MAPKIIPDSVRDVVQYDPHTGQIFGRKPTKTKAGYYQVTIDYQRYYVHRLAWFLVHGEQPEEIDHINRDRTDNRLCNLRNVTRGQNLLNNGRTGIAWCRHRNRWRACIGGKPVYQGKNYFLAAFHRHQAVIARYPIGLPCLISCWQ